MRLVGEFACDEDELPGWSQEQRRGVKYALSRVESESESGRPQVKTVL